MSALNAVFLIEAGKESGLGHLRRMQVLAGAMVRRGWQCRFGINDEALVRELEQIGESVFVWRPGSENVGPTNVLVVDGYHYDVNLLKHQQCDCRLVMDDNAVRPLSADIVLNHNLHALQLDYSAYQAQKFLLGCAYTLVDPRFVALAQGRPDMSGRVLVSFGGTDDGGYSLSVVQHLLERCSEIIVEVVLSPLMPPANEWPLLAQRFGSRLVIHHGADMIDLMKHCDTLVGAAGTTAIEALAAGMRVIVCATVDNQRRHIDSLREVGVVALKQFNVDELVEAAIVAMETQPTVLPSVSDWCGAERVVDEIEQFLSMS